MKTYYLLLACILVLTSCSKKKGNGPDKEIISDGLVQKTETANGITFRSFIKDGQTEFKGILIMGSGNDENNPTPGSLDGGPENDICKKAAQNGYAAAIVQYRKTPGNADWNASAGMIAEDYNKCIVALSDKYNIDKTKSVVGGYSYASFMLLTSNALNTDLSYCKGILAACGSTDTWKAENFKIPVFSISCSGNNEGDYSGKELYDQIPANSPVKAKSGGITDNSCNTHCGGNWTEQMYNKLTQWIN